MPEPLVPSEDDELSKPGARPLEPGRLLMFSLFGASAEGLPLPFLPAVLVGRVRGALAHDIASHHGLALTEEARKILSNAEGLESTKGVAEKLLRFVGLRILGRFGPVGLLSPVRGALEVFAFGHLFQRYVETARMRRTVRIDAGEAYAIRKTIDRALVGAITTEGRRLSPTGAPEDLRDTKTAMVDTALIFLSGLPNILLARLDAAFDEAMSKGAVS